MMHYPAKLVFGSRQFERTKLLEADRLDYALLLRRQVGAFLKAADVNSRILDFTISTESIDRYGDTIAADGWKLDAFRKNPVVLWMHDNNTLPVAKASNIRIENQQLKGRAEFTPAGLVRFNDIIFEMLKMGFLAAASVGFRPIKYKFVEAPSRPYGIDFIEQELLEFSIVTVPGNPDSLVEGKASVDAALVPAPHPNSVSLAKQKLALLRGK